MVGTPCQEEAFLGYRRQPELEAKCSAGRQSGLGERFYKSSSRSSWNLSVLTWWGGQSSDFLLRLVDMGLADLPAHLDTNRVLARGLLQLLPQSSPFSEEQGLYQ